MECGFVSHSMMILKKSSLHEEIHEVDHHKKLVFLVILQNLEKCLENFLVLVLMEYLLMEHPGQWKLTQENWLKPQLSEQHFLNWRNSNGWRSEVFIEHRSQRIKPGSLTELFRSHCC
ncbi:hypothetical protein Tco_1530965 [Tanacetum coccineum]